MKVFANSDFEVVFEKDKTVVRDNGKIGIWTRHFEIFGPENEAFQVLKTLQNLVHEDEPPRWKKALIVKTPDAPVRAYWHRPAKPVFPRVHVGDKEYRLEYDYRFGYPVHVTRNYLVYVTGKRNQFWITRGLSVPWKRDEGVFQVLNRGFNTAQKKIIFEGEMFSKIKEIFGRHDVVSSYIVRWKNKGLVQIVTTENSDFLVERKNGVVKLVEF